MKAGFYVMSLAHGLDEVQAALVCTDGSFEIKDELKAAGYRFNRALYDPWTQRHNAGGWIKTFASREEIETAITEIQATGGRVIDKQVIDEDRIPGGYAGIQ